MNADDPVNVGSGKVVVALSGGLDSSFAAACLLERGWKVYGLHLVLPAPEAVRANRREAVLAAAGRLGIPVRFLDIAGFFADKVISPFVDNYLNGRTPNPCVICNEEVKFPVICEYADSEGIDFAATGHYARLQREFGGDIKLLRGSDPAKDQSYFLHRLNPGHLARCLFPVGTMTKEQCRIEALALGLPAADVKESQEICFLHGNDYRTFLESDTRTAGSRKKGFFVTESGEVLGAHRGVHRFTVGQRHGMGIASDRPYYVKSIRPGSGHVVVGRKAEIFSRKVRLSGFRVLWREGVVDSSLHAQVRYRHKAAPGVLRLSEPGRACFTFHEAQWAVTPGQALVCYNGDVVVGGGWILEP